MTQVPLNVLFVLDSLWPVGGVERVIGTLLAHLDRSVSRPSVLVIGPHHTCDLALPEDVRISHLLRRHVRHALGALAGVFRETRPDIVFSAKTYVNVMTILAHRLAGRPGCVIASEHIHLSAHLAHQAAWSRCKYRGVYSLARWVYRWADKVVFVSEEARWDGCHRLGLAEDRAVTIYNPIVDDRLIEMASRPVEHPWFARQRPIPVILSVGRLTHQKGLCYLLRAFGEVRTHLPARLVILGDGEERDSLMDLTQTLGIREHTAFLGFQPNPYRFMARADLFVLPSLWEGMGLALVEAMACGIPVIATRCPSGPEEIITPGINGLLVPPGDADALAQAMLAALSNAGLAQAMARAGQQRAEDFRAETLVSQYERLFVEVSQRWRRDAMP